MQSKTSTAITRVIAIITTTGYFIRIAENKSPTPTVPSFTRTQALLAKSGVAL
jgi:hypothetical protein